MRCDEATELITARVDNELTAAERAAVDSHLASCEPCRAVLAAQSFFKQQVKVAGQAVAAPTALRRELEKKLSGRGSLVMTDKRRPIAAWFSFAGWRPVLAMAVVVVALGSLVYMRWPAPNLAFAAVQTHVDILNGKTALARAANPLVLRDELARAVGERFRPVALDFSMMKLYPVAGFVHKVGAREVLVTVYQGAGPTITCFTFLGSEADAPGEAERFYDADMRLNLYSFSRAGVNGVLHREANVICLLVSKMASADLLAMIRGKSAHV